MMDWSKFFTWESLVASGGIVVGIVAFVQNILTIRNLRLENELLRKQGATSGRISIPTTEEVNKYSRARNLAGTGLALMLAAGVGLLSLQMNLYRVKSQRDAAPIEALSRGLESGNRNAIVAALALGRVYADEGKYNWAQDLYRKVLTAEEARHSLSGMVAPLNGLAAVSRAQHDYPRAEALYNRSLEIQQMLTAGTSPHAVETLEGLAAVYQETGRPERAAEFETEARRLRGSLDSLPN